MAADSAVTTYNKAYTGVNKLFRLSKNPPMGIMICGKAKFVDLPLETLIKEYSKKTDFKNLKDILNIKEDFLRYLREVTPIQSPYQMIKYDLDLFEYFIGNKQQEYSKEEFENFLYSYSRSKIFYFLNNNSKFNAKIEKILLNITQDNPNITSNLLKKCFCNFLLGNSTQIIIAGFNEEDMFPSYIAFNILGNLTEDIIWQDGECQLNYNGEAIVPFAQKDVITTFLTGIDEHITYGFINYFSKFLNKYLTELKKSIQLIHINNENLPKALKEIENIENLKDKLVTDFRDNIAKMKKENYDQILQSIESMPNKEIADMCESLIKITSLKRKISSNLESVGEPIDIAIITKGDGFIWENNKNYSTIELNSQFYEKN